MAFELSVYTPKILENLESRWLDALAAEGLVCEFHPNFTIANNHRGFLPISVRVRKNSFLNSEKYGEKTLLGGFELDIESGNKSILEIDNTNRIDVCKTFIVRTAMGRSVIDFRLQCFAAAALANITGGILVDHQANSNFIGRKALENAEREAREYEEFYKENFLELPLFNGWN